MFETFSSCIIRNTSKIVHVVSSNTQHIKDLFNVTGASVPFARFKRSSTDAMLFTFVDDRCASSWRVVLLNALAALSFIGHTNHAFTSMFGCQDTASELCSMLKTRRLKRVGRRKRETSVAGLLWLKAVRFRPYSSNRTMNKFY